MTIVVNLFGSAGSGKSTSAMGLAYLLKLQGYKVEYVSEYAKDLVNEGSFHKLKHQLYVFSKQLKRMAVLKDIGLDFIITDSPLLLSSFYGEKYNTSGPLLKEMVLEYHHSFSNFNIFLERVVDYDPKLRLQTQEESDEDSLKLRKYVAEQVPIHVYGNSRQDTLESIVGRLSQIHKEREAKTQ